MGVSRVPGVGGQACAAPLRRTHRPPARRTPQNTRRLAVEQVCHHWCAVARSSRTLWSELLADLSAAKRVRGGGGVGSLLSWVERRAGTISQLALKLDDPGLW